MQQGTPQFPQASAQAAAQMANQPMAAPVEQPQAPQGQTPAVPGGQNLIHSELRSLANALDATPPITDASGRPVPTSPTGGAPQPGSPTSIAYNVPAGSETNYNQASYSSTSYTAGTAPVNPAAGSTPVHPATGSAPVNPTADSGTAPANPNQIMGDQIRGNYDRFEQGVIKTGETAATNQVQNAVEANNSVARSSLDSTVQGTAGWQPGSTSTFQTADASTNVQQTPNIQPTPTAGDTTQAPLTPTAPSAPAGAQQALNPLYGKEIRDIADAIGSAPVVMPASVHHTSLDPATGQPLPASTPAPAAPGSSQPNNTAQPPTSGEPPAQSKPQSVLGRVLFGALPIPDKTGKRQSDN